MAGIRRVTWGILEAVCERVDLVELGGGGFVEVLRGRGEWGNGRLGRIWEAGLQDWVLGEG